MHNNCCKTWLTILGILALSLPAMAEDWTFDTDGYYEDGDYRAVDGWNSDWNHVDKNSFRAENGMLTFDVTGSFLINRWGCTIDADTNRYLVLDIAIDASAPAGSGSGANTLKFNCLFQKEGQSGIPNGFQLSALANSGMNRAVVDLQAATTADKCGQLGDPWSGTVTVVRFDIPAWDQGVSGTVYIDRIALLPYPPGYEWNFDLNGNQGWAETWDAGAVVSAANGDLVIDFEDAGFNPLVRNLYNAADALEWVGTAGVNNWFYPLQLAIDPAVHHYMRFDIDMDHSSNDPVPFGAFFHMQDDDLGGVVFNVTPNAGPKTYIVDMADAVNLWPAEGDASWSGGLGAIKVLRIEPCEGLGYEDCASSQMRIHYMSLSDGSGDADSDALTDADELGAGTDPTEPDTDSDGLSDGEEVNTHGTDPLDADTDGDSASDGQEVAAGTDPLDPNDYPGSTDLPLGGTAAAAAVLLTLGARRISRVRR